jgi:hypothetical protein
MVSAAPPPCNHPAKSVHARGPLREAIPARPWAMRALCKSAMPVLCSWAVGGFSQLAFVLFFYFPNGFKTLQTSKFCASLV